MRARLPLAAVVLGAAAAAGCMAAPVAGRAPGDRDADGGPGRLLAWRDWEPVATGASGPVERVGGDLRLGAGGPLTAVRWGGEAPAPPYELEFDAVRERGNDFFVGLTFPAGDGHLTLVLGGWGGALCGLSCLDGEDASTNGTAAYRGFRNGQAYRVRLRVEAGRVRVWLDGEALLDVPLAGRACTLRPEVAGCAPLGLASYRTIACIGPLTLR